MPGGGREREEDCGVKIVVFVWFDVSLLVSVEDVIGKSGGIGDSSALEVECPF